MVTPPKTVLATGSKPFVPPISGHDAPGTFVYRTIDDLEAIADYAAGCRTGAVVGGGLLGLQVARALAVRGLDTERNADIGDLAAELNWPAPAMARLYHQVGAAFDFDRLRAAAGGEDDFDQAFDDLFEGKKR